MQIFHNSDSNLTASMKVVLRPVKVFSKRSESKPNVDPNPQQVFKPTSPYTNLSSKKQLKNQVFFLCGNSETVSPRTTNTFPRTADFGYGNENCEIIYYRQFAEKRDHVHCTLHLGYWSSEHEPLAKNIL
jgi:hypothetical protein